ncbi:hypothetical protein Tco_0033959 [Tanacetum coccineum]
MILLAHCLSHALTATADVPDVYLQQFWRTVSKVPDTEDTIKLILDTQQFIYTVDMFRDTLHLPVETPENPFVAPANIHTIEVFMNRVGYKGVVDKLFHVVLNQTHVDYADLLWWDFMNNVFQKKESIQYPCFIKLIITDLMKKFLNIPKRLEEDYHSIKDDVPLVSVYTTGNVLVRGMLIPDALLTAKIRENDDFKEYETVFMKEEIDKLVDGDDDDESSASAFADSVLNDDGNDTGSKLEPESDKEHPEHVFNDDEQKNDESIEKEKEVVEIVKETNVDDEMKKKDEEVEKEKEVVEIVKETNVDDTSAKKHNEVVMEKRLLICRIVPELTVTNTNEMLKKEMPRLVKHAINKEPRSLSFEISGIIQEHLDRISTAHYAVLITIASQSRQHVHFGFSNSYSRQTADTFFNNQLTVGSEKVDRICSVTSGEMKQESVRDLMDREGCALASLFHDD